MKQYRVYSNDGIATVYAESLNKAWEQAYNLFTDVLDVEFVSYVQD
mgnify:CR=1 FL=1